VPVASQVDFRSDLARQENDELLQRHLGRGRHGDAARGHVGAHRETERGLGRVDELLEGRAQLGVLEPDRPNHLGKEPP
jgi:hypothetical protein